MRGIDTIAAGPALNPIARVAAAVLGAANAPRTVGAAAYAVGADPDWGKLASGLLKTAGSAISDGGSGGGGVDAQKAALVQMQAAQAQADATMYRNIAIGGAVAVVIAYLAFWRKP
jgi:hypothetical protein